jgi:hypothetical protein
MCTDALHPAIPEPSVAKVDDVSVLENNDVPADKRPTIRFSFMGRSVEDLTDDDEPHLSDLDSVDETNDEADESDLDSVDAESDSEEGKIGRAEGMLLLRD